MHLCLQLMRARYEAPSVGNSLFDFACQLAYFRSPVNPAVQSVGFRLESRRRRRSPPRVGRAIDHLTSVRPPARSFRSVPPIDLILALFLIAQFLPTFRPSQKAQP